MRARPVDEYRQVFHPRALRARLTSCDSPEALDRTLVELEAEVDGCIAAMRAAALFPGGPVAAGFTADALHVLAMGHDGAQTELMSVAYLQMEPDLLEAVVAQGLGARSAVAEAVAGWAPVLTPRAWRAILSAPVTATTQERLDGRPETARERATHAASALRDILAEFEVSAPAAQRDTALLAPYLRLREVLRRAEAVVQPGPDAAPLVGVLLAAAAAHPLPDATESEQARWRALLATAPAVEQYDVSLEEEAAERDAERDAERSNALAGSWQGEEASAVLDVAACEVSAEVRPEPSDEWDPHATEAILRTALSMSAATFDDLERLVPQVARTDTGGHELRRLLATQPAATDALVVRLAQACPTPQAVCDLAGAARVWAMPDVRASLLASTAGAERSEGARSCLERVVSFAPFDEFVLLCRRFKAALPETIGYALIHRRGEFGESLPDDLVQWIAGSGRLVRWLTEEAEPTAWDPSRSADWLELMEGGEWPTPEIAQLAASHDASVQASHAINAALRAETPRPTDRLLARVRAARSRGRRL